MASGKTFPIFEGAHARFLDDILCVLIVARQPSRQIVRRVEVWQNCVIESGQWVLVRQSLPLKLFANHSYKPQVAQFYSRTRRLFLVGFYRC